MLLDTEQSPDWPQAKTHTLPVLHFFGGEMREESVCVLAAETLGTRWQSQLGCISDMRTSKQTFIAFSGSSMAKKKNRSSFQTLCCLVATQILKQFSKRERFSSCFSCSCPNWFFQPFVFLAFLKHICIWGLGYHCCVMTWDHLALHKTGINPTYTWCLRNTFGSCS